MGKVKKLNWVAAVKRLSVNCLLRKVFSAAIALFMPFAHGMELIASSHISIPESFQANIGSDDSDWHLQYLGLRLFNTASDPSCINYDETSMKSIIESDGKLQVGSVSQNINGWKGNDHQQTSVDNLGVSSINGTLNVNLMNTSTKEITTYIGFYTYQKSDSIWKADKMICYVAKSLTIPAQKVCHAVVNNINANLNTASTSDTRYHFISGVSDGASLSITPDPHSIDTGLQEGILKDNNGKSGPSYTLPDAQWNGSGWTLKTDKLVSKEALISFSSLSNKSVSAGKYTGTAAVTLSCE